MMQTFRQKRAVYANVLLLRNDSRCRIVLYSAMIQTTFRCTVGFTVIAYTNEYEECACFLGIDGAQALGSAHALCCAHSHTQASQSLSAIWCCNVWKAARTSGE